MYVYLYVVSKLPNGWTEFSLHSVTDPGGAGALAMKFCP